jgi:hypothetical protein
MNDTGGDIQLLAGTNLRLQSDAAVATTGQGSLLLVAGFVRAIRARPLVRSHKAASRRSRPNTGNITLTAADDVSIDQIVSVDGNIFITAGVRSDRTADRGSNTR